MTNRTKLESQIVYVHATAELEEAIAVELATQDTEADHEKLAALLSEVTPKVAESDQEKTV